MRRAAWVILALGYVGGVLYFSWTPASAHTGGATEVEVKRWLFNLLHPPVYAGMTGLLFGAISPNWRWSLRAGLTAAAIAIVVGIAGEIGQYWVPTREPDVMDATLNAVGAVLAMYIIWKITREKKSTRPVGNDAEPGQRT